MPETGFMREAAYLGVKGSVAAIEVSTGMELWRCKLRTSTVTNVVVAGESILVYANGYLFGLKAATGEILWENGLEGLGYGYGILAVGDKNPAVAVLGAVSGYETVPEFR